MTTNKQVIITETSSELDRIIDPDCTAPSYFQRFSCETKVYSATVSKRNAPTTHVTSGTGLCMRTQSGCHGIIYLLNILAVLA